MNDIPWLDGILRDVLPVLTAIVLASGLVVIAVVLFTTRTEREKILILVLGLATLGAVAGVAGGTSRVGVVGDIIPAALALAGGVSAYLFGVDRSKGLIASVCAAAFALALGFGYAAGAGNRGVTDRYSSHLLACRSGILNPDILKDDRSYCRFVSTLGEQCAHLIANDLSRIAPEKMGSGQKSTLDYYRELRHGMISEFKKHLKNITKCDWTPLDPAYRTLPPPTEP